MEWAFDMKWTLVSQPKGTALSLIAPKATGLPAKTVVTKYPVVGVSAAIIPGGALLDGQNSEGLSMSGNFLPGFTQYQTVTPQDKDYQSVLTFGSWALGNFANVADLREALKTMKVWADDSLPTGPTPATLHFVFVDRGGAGMVVEYVGGEVNIHDNIAHVLTNAPTYDWHINNIRNYLSLSTVGVQQRQIGTVNVTEIGQGGGFIGLPADYTPPSRFLRATALRHTVTPPKTADRSHTGGCAYSQQCRHPDRRCAVALARRHTRLGLHAMDRGQGPEQQRAQDRRLQQSAELPDDRSERGVCRRQADGEAGQRSALSEVGGRCRSDASGNQRGGVQVSPMR